MTSCGYWIVYVTSVLTLFAFSTPSTAYRCPVSLPQGVPQGSLCEVLRRQDLEYNQKTFRLKAPEHAYPYALTDTSPEELKKVLKSDAFALPFVVATELRSKGLMKIAAAYNKTHAAKRKISSLKDYAELRKYFRGGIQGLGDSLRIPSDYEAFQDNFTKWIEDEFFAQQRLAGVNPMSLQGVSSYKRGIEGDGLDWSQLNKNLNPDFDWEEAVQEALGADISLRKAINESRLYVLRYPLCDDLPVTEVKQSDPQRFIQRTRSPIALFVSSSEFSGGLKPVAIQMDYTPVSPVHTPQDGHDWMLAKLNVQTTDLAFGQIVEHLVKVHFLMETMCVVMKRHFPSQHPVHQILKFHCRDVTLLNVNTRPTLLSEDGYANTLYAHGRKGTAQLIREAQPFTTWEATDFRGNLKRRGMTSKERIPYFPYRDDGEVIFCEIEATVEEYVNQFYLRDRDVQDDAELQAFANEVSADGKGRDGGNGKIEGFPAKIASVVQLQEILTRMIWQLAGQHASVSYELSDYASYLPNMPAATYAETKDGGQFSYTTFADRTTAVKHLLFVMGLSTFRYDRLFDYGRKLQDNNSGRIVWRHFSRLRQIIEPSLEDRNNERLKKGQLTYPHLLPRWLPNGIQT